jgi:hypothetical protein
VNRDGIIFTAPHPPASKPSKRLLDLPGNRFLNGHLASDDGSVRSARDAVRLDDRRLRLGDFRYTVLAVGPAHLVLILIARLFRRSFSRFVSDLDRPFCHP